MNFRTTGDNMQAYQNVASETGVTCASPHRLIQMLLEGALDKIAVAKGAIERKNFEEKSRYISWAISIIKGLDASLDRDEGGEIASNLDELYHYMERTLIQANAENNPILLDETSSLLHELKSGWDAIPQEFHHRNETLSSPSTST